MKKILLAATVAATFAVAAPPAQACTLETCWFSQPVCSQIDCDTTICWYQPGGGSQCIG